MARRNTHATVQPSRNLRSVQLFHEQTLGPVVPMDSRWKKPSLVERAQTRRAARRVERGARCDQRDARGVVQRVAVGAGRDRRERELRAVVLGCQLDRVAVAGGQELGLTVIAGLMLPMMSAEAPLGLFGGMLAIVYLLGLGRFFLALGGLDTGSSFGGLGAMAGILPAWLLVPGPKHAAQQLRDPAVRARLRTECDRYWRFIHRGEWQRVRLQSSAEFPELAGMTFPGNAVSEITLPVA